MATCRQCIHWDKCSKEDGTTRYYGEKIAAGNVEKLCEWFINAADVTGEVVRDILSLIDDKIRYEVEIYNGFHSLRNGKTICQERVNALNDIKLIINHQFRVTPQSEYMEIFWEIDKLLTKIITDDEDGTSFIGVDMQKYYALKMKYTEGKYGK